MPFEITKEFYVESIGVLKRKPVYHFLKRVFDIVVSLAALSIFAIPMILIAIVIKCTSPGTVLYRQERLGLNGKKFNILKFRTMRTDAESDGAQWSSGDSDVRITPVGAILRRFRMDEIPQFLCTLRGTMSIVGPRPERACFYEVFETYVHGFHQRLAVKPGFTGLAQVNGGYNLRPEEKILYDIEYIKKRNLWLDFVILLKTVGVVLRHSDQKEKPEKTNIE